MVSIKELYYDARPTRSQDMVKAVGTLLKFWAAKTPKNCVANHEGGGVTTQNQTHQNPKPTKIQEKISDTPMNRRSHSGVDS